MNAQRLFISGLFLLLFIQPVHAQDDTFLPRDLQPITVENATQVEQIGALGYGDVQDMAWLSDGTLAITSATGIRLHDSENLEALPRLINREGRITGRVFLTPNPEIAAVIDDTNWLSLWQTRTGIHQGIGQDISFSSWGFSPRGDVLMIGNTRAIFSSLLNKSPIPGVNDNSLFSSCSHGGIGVHALSPDLHYFAFSACLDLYLLNTETGQRTKFGYTGGTIPEVNFSPDGRWMLIASYEITRDPENVLIEYTHGFVQLIDTTTGTEHSLFTLEDKSIMFATFSPNGAMIAATSWNSERGELTLHLWETEAFLAGQTNDSIEIGLSKRLLNDDMPVHFNPNGTQMAFRGDDARIHVWNITDESDAWAEISVIGEPDYVGNEIVFSPDGSQIAFNGVGGFVHIWSINGETTTWTESNLIEDYVGGGDRFALSPDSRLLARPNGCVIEVWNLETHTLQSALNDHCTSTNGIRPFFVTDLAFSPDSSHLLSVSYEVYLWNIETGQLERDLGGVDTGEGGHRVNFTPNGEPREAFFILGSVYLTNYDVPNRIPFTGSIDYATGAFSPDGNLIALGTTEGFIYFYDTLSGELQSSLEVGLPAYPMRYSADGAILTISNRFSELGGSIQFWDINTNTNLMTIEFSNPLTSFRFSSDAHLFTTIESNSQRITLWDRYTGRPLNNLYGHFRTISADGYYGETHNDVYATEFSADDRLLVSTGGDTIRFWGIPSE